MVNNAISNGFHHIIEYYFPKTLMKILRLERLWSVLLIKNMASPELACVYAALILNDDGIEITAEKVNALLKAANVTLESYWVDLFAEYFKSHDISELVKGTCLGGAAPAAGAAAAGGAAAEEAKEEKKEEEEVVELAGGFDDLFG